MKADASPQSSALSGFEQSDNRWRFGPQMRREGGVVFRLFAPAAEQVRLAVGEHAADAREPVEMRACDGGWHELAVPDAGGGTRYQFVLPDGTRVPDPASRCAPLGVHGPSEVVNPQFAWKDAEWRGRAWREAVLYELHVGTFTQEGTFRAAAEKLDFLEELGVTAIELMCICAFAGERSWGYDGVQWFAPDATYGRPEDLKAFVDAAHARGMMVLLDVVYNHFGPEGNYIPLYFPQIFSKEHTTAWGPGLSFDGAGCREVREFVVENAVFWVEEFHVDGLRVDASHALIDDSPKHILDEISERVQAAAGERQVHLILENEKAIGRLLKRDVKGRTLYRAQWNHAVDHIIGLAMTGDCDAANEQQQHDTEELARALAEGFFAGDVSCSAEDSTTIPPTAFVDFTQTHDLVGNRVFGERLCELATPEAVRAASAVVLMLPQIPMLFMGQEWAATSPFPFFSDFGGELAEAVRRGRCAQLKRESNADDATLARAPDPQAESTFFSAKLCWEELDDPAHREKVDWCRQVLAARRERIIPLLNGMTERCGRYDVLGVGQFVCEWTVRESGMLRLMANLCRSGSGAFGPCDRDEVLWLQGRQAEDGGLAPWTVRWSFRRTPER